jgi:hypothetical protein
MATTVPAASPRGPGDSSLLEANMLRSPSRLALATFVLLVVVRPIPAQEPKKNDQPDLKKEIERAHEELANIIRQHTDIIKTLNPRAPGVKPAGRPNGNGNGNGPAKIVGQGRTGFAVGPIPAELREHLKQTMNLDPNVGLSIERVFPDTPAAEAGYKKGDVLLEFNKQPVPSDVAAFMGITPFIKSGVPVAGAVSRFDKRVDMKDMVLSDRKVVPDSTVSPDSEPKCMFQPAPSPTTRPGADPRIPGYRVKRTGGITEITPNVPDR